MNRLPRVVLALLGATPFIHLLSGCKFTPPAAAPPPFTTAIFCDIEADRRCASSDDIMMGVDVARPFEAGFWVNKSSPIGLDYSAAALAACGGGPQAVVFRDAFPNGTPVCLSPSVFPSPHASINAACQAWCYEQDFIDGNGDKYSCKDIAWQSNGVPQVGSSDGPGFADGCTEAGTLRADFQDPRKVRPTVPVAWQTFTAVGVSVLGNNLMKIAATGWGSADPAFEAGAVSTQRLLSGDGAAFTTVDETNSLRIFGLGSGNDCRTFEDLEFGLLLTQAGTLLVLEQGVFVGTVGSYAHNDTLQVGVESGVVVYRQNGNVLFTSTVPPSYPLQMEAAFNFSGATIKNARVTF